MAKINNEINIRTNDKDYFKQYNFQIKSKCYYAHRILLVIGYRRLVDSKDLRSNSVFKYILCREKGPSE